MTPTQTAATDRERVEAELAPLITAFAAYREGVDRLNRDFAEYLVRLDAAQGKK